MLNCSSEEFEFISDLFMKDDSSDLFLEMDFNFKLIPHERDFAPGLAIHANIVDATEHSRRMFMILSRLLYYWVQTVI